MSSKRPSQTKQQIQTEELSLELLTEKDRVRDFYNVPTSPATDSVFSVLGVGKDLKKLEQRAASHSRKIEVSESINDKNRKRVLSSSDTATVTLVIPDVEKLSSTKKPAKKMFVFSLIKMNDQAFSGGVMRRDFIQFPLKELVDIKYYSSLRSARRGFNDAMDTLTSMKLTGTLKKGNNDIVQDSIEVLFTGANIKKGTCTIYLNRRINWAFLAAFYTIMPKYYFSLPNRASDLLYYIFYLARQRIRDIEERNYFTISMRAVQERLNLPNEVGNKDPQRTIKQPIEEAIEAIEEASHNSEFTITPIYNESDPITTFLSNGYLKIGLKGSYAKRFIQLSKKTSRQIQAMRKRRETIKDKALAANLAKKIQSKEHN